MVGLAARIDRRRRRAPALPPAAAAPDTRVVVLLPVRDEEDEVEGCLETLVAQTATPRIVVIDDGSTDDTVAKVEAVARRHPGRIERVAAGPLPPGWRGKVHALAAGLAHHQNRSHPASRTVEDDRRGRIRRVRMGRLVQQPAPARIDRRYPAGRVRAGIL
jgi:cellulose synthase/poly-beta-1,6-N-acetylglucosamine synthase-like glycosyltransferase